MFKELLKDESDIIPGILAQTDHYIHESLQSGLTEDLNILSEYLQGGKKLRPFILASFVEMLDGDRDIAARLAASVEMYHNATLIFDDIQDNSLIRRGKPTLNKRFGVGVALSYATVLRALITKPYNDHFPQDKFIHVSRWINKVAIMLSEGQLMEMLWAYNKEFNVSEALYLQMVRKKTGSLIGLSATFGGIASGFDDNELLFDIGCDLGIAYQIIDDIMNIENEADQYKDKYSDVYERKITLLVVHSVLAGKKYENVLKHVFSKDEIDERDVSEVVDIFVQSGALKKSYRIANEYIDTAVHKIKSLPLSRQASTEKFINKIKVIFKNAQNKI